MPINGSDSPSPTESKEAAGPGPEQHNYAARSLYAPKRERLTHGGPPVHLGKPLVIDVPRFPVAPDSIDDEGQSQPNRSPFRTISGSELLGSDGAIRRGTARSSPASTPALRLDTDVLEEGLQRLKRKSPALDRLRVDALIPRHGHQAAENTGQCARVRGSLESEHLPPALMRAQRSPPLKKLRGPLLILIVGAAATAYFVTGSSVPPPDTTSEPNLAAAGLKATIAPPLLALQSEIKPTQLRNDNPDRQTSHSGETWTSAAPDRIFPVRIEYWSS